MIYKLHNNTTHICQLRRRWRKSRQYTVRVTSTGVVSVIRMPLHEDMKTEAQLKCRQRFVRAQQLMLNALTDMKKIRFFQKRRDKYGYKTLRGCILAYYIEELKRQEETAQVMELAEKVRIILSNFIVGDKRHATASETLYSATPKPTYCDTPPSVDEVKRYIVINERFFDRPDV